MNGVELIAAERQRQVEEEGWTSQHDDQHDGYELNRAAMCYMTAAVADRAPQSILPPFDWPWEPSQWKPVATSGGPEGLPSLTNSDRIGNLVKAAALIAAEIDRLQRALSKEGEDDC
jgi:hypothetical protein